MTLILALFGVICHGMPYGVICYFVAVMHTKGSLPWEEKVQKTSSLQKGIDFFAPIL